MSGIRSAIRIWKERRKLRNDFEYFCEVNVFAKLPRRAPARHHAVVCRWIQELADDPEGGILIILMPPGGGKSMIAARALPAWAMGRDAGVRVLEVTNSMPLAESHGRAIRDVVQTKGYEHAMDATLNPSQAAAGAFSLTNGSEFFAVGSYGAQLGRRSEWLIIDDPISGIEEASSTTMMAKLHAAWESNLKTRILPGSKVVIIQQRLSVNDLAGYIMANPVEGGIKVRVLRMPMECDDPANDPLGRAEGEPLWPEFWTPAMMAEAKSNEMKWVTLYQQKPPTDVNQWASAENILSTPRPFVPSGGNDDWRVYVGCDVASSVNRGDCTVFAVIGFERRTGAMHILDLWRRQCDPDTGTDGLLEMIRSWRPSLTLIDDDTGSKGFVSHLKTKGLYSGVPLNSIELIPIRGQNKESRAGALRAKIAARMLHVDRSAPWAKDVLRELLMFPNATGSAVDDIVDALSLIARKTTAMMVQKVAAPREVAPLNRTATLDELWEAREHGQRGFGRSGGMDGRI